MAEYSTAFFKDACTQNGLADLYDKMVGFGWSTLGRFAFSSAYVPGQIDESAFVKGVVVRLGLTEDDMRISGLRRLFFEAYTTSASELRRRANLQQSDDKAKMCDWNLTSVKMHLEVVAQGRSGESAFALAALKFCELVKRNRRGCARLQV